jgi:hypothetical protein
LLTCPWSRHIAITKPAEFRSPRRGRFLSLDPAVMATPYVVRATAYARFVPFWAYDWPDIGGQFSGYRNGCQVNALLRNKWKIAHITTGTFTGKVFRRILAQNFRDSWLLHENG